MSGTEFIQSVLAGERNFTGMALEDGFDLCGHERFTELQDYLKRCDLQQQPLDLSGARCRGLSADGWHLPFVRAANASFREAKLLGANLEGAVLTGADLRHVCLAGGKLDRADLGNADLRAADFNLASLKGAKLGGADCLLTSLEFTNMMKADLRGIRNLDRARFVASVNYQMVTIGAAEKEIIRNALWAQDGRKLRMFGGSG
jgi:uncharacterized protein YjbI with pentapeptide repeats